MPGTYGGSHQEYDVICESNVMVRMRDGVMLATDIYFPAMDGRRADDKFPVILERTPYDKAAPNNVTKGKYFGRRGYVCAIQDVRGRFKSDGEWYAFALEAPDGHDAVEWLGIQPWSEGKIGTMGDSYCGSVQAALATLNPAPPCHDDCGRRRFQLLPQRDAPERRAGAAVPRVCLPDGR